LFFVFIAATALTNFPVIDWNALDADLRKFVVTDTPPFQHIRHHGPYIVRLAWHCAGTYRSTDGRGGCDGASITQAPVRDWGDNAGLPELINALKPIKEKYPLTWGDFIVYVGNFVIAEMQGPKVPFCGGRTDFTAEEAAKEASYFNADRFLPHHDLIYVNPEKDTAQQVRETFARMGFNDQQTVAVVGGGHAFGGCHASRSGFNGLWTSQPNTFSQDYFKLLMQHYDGTRRYEPHTVSATNHQFQNDQGLMMLKTDLENVVDPSYLLWTQIYANDFDQIFKDFGLAWQLLMDRDAGDRPCLGPDFPAPEPLQAPNADIAAAKLKIRDIINSSGAQMASKVARLVWRCAASHRSTDNRGGCNGFTILHEPEAGWSSNGGLSVFQNLFYGMKHANIGLTMADTIVLAGNVAIEMMGGPEMPFCHGRQDYSSGEKSKLLNENAPMEDRLSARNITEGFYLMGVKIEDAIAILAGGEAMGLGAADFTQAPAAAEFCEKSSCHDRVLGTLAAGNQDYQRELGRFTTDAAERKRKFGQAWTRLVNADRYHGICDPFVKAYIETGQLAATTQPKETDADSDGTPSDAENATAETSVSEIVAWVVTGCLVLLVLICFVMVIQVKMESQMILNNKADPEKRGAELPRGSE